MAQMDGFVVSASILYGMWAATQFVRVDASRTFFEALFIALLLHLPLHMPGVIVALLFLSFINVLPVIISAFKDIYVFCKRLLRWTKNVHNQ